MSIKGLNPFRKSETSSAVASIAPVVNKPGYVSAASGEPAIRETRHQGGSRMWDERTGEVNAWSKKDAAVQIRRFAAMAAAGELVRNDLETLLPKKERQQAVLAAYHDRTGQAWQSLGADLALKIQERQQREGFLGSVLSEHPIEDGQDPKIVMPRKAAEAVVSAGVESVEFQQVRSKIIHPTEVTLVANLRVTTLEIKQQGQDVLEEAYNQGFEAIGVKKDRMLKKAADILAEVGINPTILLGGPLTPATLSQIRRGLTDHGLPVGVTLMSNQFWDDLLGTASFTADLFDPVTRYNLVQDGVIGQLFGSPLLTDAFRDPEYRVLQDRELYLLAPSQFLGGYTDRNGIEATPVNGAETGSASKGWFMEDHFSLAMVNSKAVQRAYK